MPTTSRCKKSDKTSSCEKKRCTRAVMKKQMSKARKEGKPYVASVGKSLAIANKACGLPAYKPKGPPKLKRTWRARSTVKKEKK